MELPSCPCCVAPYLVFQMFIVFLVLYYTTSSLLIGKKSSRLWKGLMFSLNAILLVLFFIAIAVTQSSEFRAWFFSRLFYFFDLASPSLKMLRAVVFAIALARAIPVFNYQGWLSR